jgi:1-acyl-sn-glycerol-3-phosphate acyltransferase
VTAGGAADRFLARRPDILDQDRAWPAFQRVFAALLAPLALYHRYRCHGLETFPAGPCLIVGNHSSGSIPEIFLLLRAWRAVHGDRPVRGLAHRVAFQLPLKLVPVAAWIGGIFAHPEAAKRAFARGASVLVFPGGDADACRSFGQRDQVVFAGRAGFARLAREARVPIVPLAISGSHACYVLLPGGPLLARALGLNRLFGLKSFFISVGMLLVAAAGVATALRPELWPLLLAAAIQAPIPAPTRIEAALLDPVEPLPGETDEALAERVRATIEARVREMSSRRWTPWG